MAIYLKTRAPSKQIEMADLIRAYLERVERDAKGVPIKLYPFMRSQPLREQPRTVAIESHD